MSSNPNSPMPLFKFETNLATDALTLKITMAGRTEGFSVDGFQFETRPENTLPAKYAVFHSEYSAAVDSFKAQREADAQDV